MGWERNDGCGIFMRKLWLIEIHEDERTCYYTEVFPSEWIDDCGRITHDWAYL